MAPPQTKRHHHEKTHTKQARRWILGGKLKVAPVVRPEILLNGLNLFRLWLLQKQVGVCECECVSVSVSVSECVSVCVSVYVYVYVYVYLYVYVCAPFNHASGEEFCRDSLFMVSIGS